MLGLVFGFGEPGFWTALIGRERSWFFTVERHRRFSYEEASLNSRASQNGDEADDHLELLEREGSNGSTMTRIPKSDFHWLQFKVKVTR